MYTSICATSTEPNRLRCYRVSILPCGRKVGAIQHFGAVAKVLEGSEAPLPYAGVFEFPDRETALAFYESERYAPIKAERREAQEARMFVVDAA